MPTDYTTEAARAAGPDIDEDDEPDTIDAVRASLANLRTTWRHRSPESIDRNLARIDDRLAALDVPEELVELFGSDGARDVLRAARKLVNRV